MCVKNKFERKTKGNPTAQSSTNPVELYEAVTLSTNDMKVQPNPAYGTSQNMELQQNPAYDITNKVVMDNDPDYIWNLKLLTLSWVFTDV